MTCVARTDEVKLSSGPIAPFDEEAPGLGAPLAPPPAGISVAAVGSGAVDDGFAEEEELLLVVVLPVFVPFPVACAGAEVMVKTTPLVKVLTTRPAPRVSPVVKEVERMIEAF